MKGVGKSEKVIEFDIFEIFKISIVYTHRMILVQTRPLNIQFSLRKHKFNFEFLCKLYDIYIINSDMRART